MSEGFGNSRPTGIWCRIGAGKVIRSADATTEGAVKVEKVDAQNKPMFDEAGNKLYVYQLQSSTVGGKLVKLYSTADAYNGTEVRKLVAVLQLSNGERIYVQVKEGSRYWMAFANCLMNVDLDRVVVLSPYDYVRRKDGKRLIGMAVKQDDKDVPWAFTKDSPNGPPKLEPVRLADGSELKQNGKVVWHWQPIIDWYNKHVIELIGKGLADKYGDAAPEPVEQRPIENQAAVYGEGLNTDSGFGAPADHVDDEDLPF